MKVNDNERKLSETAKKILQVNIELGLIFCQGVFLLVNILLSLNVHIMHMEMFTLLQQSRRTQHAHRTGLKVYFEGKQHQ